MKSVFFGLVALASAVIAQGEYFQISTPRKGTTLIPGEVSTIRWTEGLKGKVLINILKGDDPHLMVPTGMVFTTLGEQNVQRWRVPSNLDSTDTYALEFNFKLPNGEISQSFSDQFKVASVAATPMTETKVVDSEQSMTNSQASNKISSFYDEPNSNTDETNMIQRQAPVSSTSGQQRMGSTSQDMRQTAQDMRQTAQGTLKKPARGKMRIIIQYPSEEEEEMGTAPVKAAGGSLKTDSTENVSSEYESVLDAAAAEAAEAKYSAGAAGTRAKAISASTVKSAGAARGAVKGASAAKVAGAVKVASKSEHIN